MLVSVLMPVFNASPYLASAVRSVLQQDFTDFELIALDDGSTDGSSELLQAFAREDSRVVVVSRENRGLIATLNEGLERARGNFVARMDADDLSMPDRLSRQLRNFEETPDLALCGSNHHVIIAPDRVSDPRYPSTPFTDEQAATISRFYAPFSHPSAMFNRRVLGPGELRYNIDYPHAEDFELFRSIARRHRIRVLTEKLVAIRRYGESVMTRHFWTMRRSHYRIVEENLAAYGLNLGPVSALLDFDANAEGAGASRAVRAAACMRAVREHAAALSDLERAAYEIGYGTLYRHVFETIRLDRGLPAAASFVEASDGWGHFRRRERYLLKQARIAAPLWTVMTRIDEGRARREGGELGSVLSNYNVLNGAAPSGSSQTVATAVAR